jgi:hypothetical protein
MVIVSYIDFSTGVIHHREKYTTITRHLIDSWKKHVHECFENEVHPILEINSKDYLVLRYIFKPHDIMIYVIMGEDLIIQKQEKNERHSYKHEISQYLGHGQ